ncbi:hypothetical protein Peur_020724 [Populus x canadensis]
MIVWWPVTQKIGFGVCSKEHDELLMIRSARLMTAKAPNGAAVIETINREEAKEINKGEEEGKRWRKLCTPNSAALIKLAPLPTVLNARLATFAPTPSVDLSLIVACTCEGNIVGARKESYLKFMIRVRGSYFQLLSNFISSDNSREINIWQAHYS